MSSQTPPEQGSTPTAPPVAAPPSPPQTKTRSRGLMLRLLGVVLLVAAIAWGLWYYFDGRWYEGTDDAYVNGNVVQLTPQIAGTVISIGADDGDRVHAGDVLIKLDRSNADVALAGAKADLAGTVRKVRGLYSSVSGAQADVAARKTAVGKARADYNRRVALAKSGAISAEELSHASDALTTAESGLIAAQNGDDRLSDDELYATSILLGFAGHVTTAQAATNLLLLLAKHRGIDDERRNRVNGDALGCVLQRHRLGQRDDTTLGR